MQARYTQSPKIIIEMTQNFTKRLATSLVNYGPCVSTRSGYDGKEALFCICDSLNKFKI